MQNFIIGYGETLTSTVEVKNGSGGKNHPYTEEEARGRFERGLSHIMTDIMDKPDVECANNEVVIKFMQHPTYLAKSYYPRSLFKKFGMRDIGSKAITIKPDKWGVKKHPTDAIASCIYVSGSKESYQKMLSAVKDNDLDKAGLDLIRTIEKIGIFDESEKIKHIDMDVENLRLEVVIHASQKDHYVVTAFINYIGLLGGLVETAKMKVVGGLTFVPIVISQGEEQNVAKFSQLRVLRSIPQLRVNKPDVLRTSLKNNCTLPDSNALNKDIKVCIFDGGIGNHHLLDRWVNETVPSDVTKSYPAWLTHGGEVCSAYLFGPYNMDKGEFDAPYTDVDIVRVMSPDDGGDPDLFDVLNRIENVLKENKYKYINLSLGPRIAIEDDEVHVWTSVLDSYLQDGSCLATIAIGNDGDLSGDFARIQPPSDMVNSLAVGSSDSNLASWNRAPYSCKGPGRSPGIIKPDGIIFGGSEEELFNVYSPVSDSIVGTMGTSYSAPYALRTAVAIDAITDFELSATAIKALMIHNTEKDLHHFHEAGWGRFPNNPEEVIECLEDEATIIFQGVLKPSEYLRIPVPLPENAQCTWVHLSATFCINTVTDPEHPLHYTRNGLEISFRPNYSKVKDKATHAKTHSFFSCKKLYPDEQMLRDDAHKWETNLSQSAKFKRTTLDGPIFDVKYHSREQGGTASSGVDPIPYCLVLTIRTEGYNQLYNLILQENRSLQAIKVRSRIRV
jgi:hypothetical protein